MTDHSAEFGPNTGPGRIDMLDAIRGFALFGILLMNLEAFNGPILLAMSGVDPALHGANRMADAFIYVFVQGKFWTLFSLLFGIGFAIASQVQTLQRPDISIRPLAGIPPMLSTYLLRRRGEPSEPMRRFIERVKDGAAPVDDEPVL